MVLIGQTSYVANFSAWGQQLKNDVIMVVNTNTDVMTDTIKVGIEPNSMVADKDDNIWILCSGGWSNNEFPTLWKINGSNGEVIHTYTFEVLESSPIGLKMNGEGDQLYFLNNGVFNMSISEDELPSTPLISQDNNKFFGYLGIDPSNGDIYIGDPKDYISTGKVYRHSIDGSLINEMEAGISPGAFGFNY